MTQTMKQFTVGWRRRAGLAIVGAAVAVAAILGPEMTAMSRIGASEVAGFATVSAADTITSADVLAEVAAGSRSQL